MGSLGGAVGLSENHRDLRGLVSYFAADPRTGCVPPGKKKDIPEWGLRRDTRVSKQGISEDEWMVCVHLEEWDGDTTKLPTKVTRVSMGYGKIVRKRAVVFADMDRAIKLAMIKWYGNRTPLWNAVDAIINKSTG
mmetsp:Transcript_4730/g.10650  ORF Transcript_4730/g.10650 Transcript_4730/m.10650 type:complete len:135 (+) Transcript_4730:276-680(+)